MAITYNWTFPQFEAIPSDGGLQDVVTIMHWNLEAVDDTDGLNSSVFGTVPVPPPDPNNYTPFSSITKADAVGWAEQELDVAQMQALLADNIQKQRNPPSVVLPPPFNN